MLDCWMHGYVYSARMQRATELCQEGKERKLNFRKIKPEIEGEICTFQVLGCQNDRTQVIVFDKGFDLATDAGAIKAHHEELAHLPVAKATRGARVPR